MELLWLDATIRPPQVSRTYRLAQAYIEALQTVKPLHVTHLPLIDLPDIAPLNRETLALREGFSHQRIFDHPIFDRAKAFASADLIVVAAPFWDYAFPAILKAYIEQVSVSGLTFLNDPDPHWKLCRAQKLVYITTAGGPVEGQDEGASYIKALCARLFRIPQVEVISLSCLDMYPDQAEDLLAQAIDRAIASATNI